MFLLKYDTIESIELLDSVVAWSSSLKKKFVNRDFRPVVMNTDGKSVLITRYLRPIEPPKELIDNSETSFETAVSKKLRNSKKIFIKNFCCCCLDECG